MIDRSGTVTLHFPALPSQLFGGSAHQAAADEFRGMIFCPWKGGEIALMRCAEWRALCGREASCPTKASESDIARAAAAMAEPVPHESMTTRGDRSRLQLDDNHYQRAKRTKMYGDCACGRAAVYKSTRECITCYWRRRNGKQNG